MFAGSNDAERVAEKRAPLGRVLSTLRSGTNRGGKSADCHLPWLRCSIGFSVNADYLRDF